MITYHKGPLGYSVMIGGNALGSIKKRGGFWVVSIVGFRPGIGDGKSHVFRTLNAAKKAITEETLGQR